MKRFELSSSIHIDAPPERVFAVASDPAQVPSYAPEVIRIDEVKRISGRERIVQSSIRIAGFRLRYLYKYRLRPNSRYSGIQEDGRLLRGYFNFRFRPEFTGTRVDHTEGLMSPVPGLAFAAGFIYFRLLGNDDLDVELQRLKELCER